MTVAGPTRQLRQLWGTSASFVPFLLLSIFYGNRALFFNPKNCSFTTKEEKL